MCIVSRQRLIIILFSFFTVFVSCPLLVPRAGARWLLSSAGDPEIPLCPVFTHERTIINKIKKRAELSGGIVLSAPPRPEGLSPASRMGVHGSTRRIRRFRCSRAPTTRTKAAGISISRVLLWCSPPPENGICVLKDCSAAHALCNVFHQ